METGYGSFYRELYQKHWWWRAREEAIVRVLRENAPANGWGHILDIGCGDGLFFDRLSEFGEVEGIESAAEVVTRDGAHRQRIYVGPFDESFQPDKKFGLVLMLDVLEHFPVAVGALEYALSLLQPHGMLLATVPAFKLLWTNHDVINHHVTRYTKTTFRTLASAAGMTIEKERYLFQWTVAAKLARRAVETTLQLSPSNPVIPPKWMNQLLFQFSRAELKTLGALPCPFGSSLLVIGRRSGG